MAAPRLQILIADDEQDMVESLVDRLQFRNFTVEAAQDGHQAIEMARTKRPELLILDIMMPNITGDKVCKLLKEDPNTQDIPILMLTAKNDLDTKSKMFSLGADEYITKPFDYNKIEQKIQNLLTLPKKKPQEITLPLIPDLEDTPEIELNEAQIDGYIVGFKNDLTLDTSVAQQLETIIYDFGFETKMLSTDIRWMKITKEQAKNLKARLPELIIAPNTPHYIIDPESSYNMLMYPPLKNFIRIDTTSSVVRNIKITVIDESSNSPINKAKVYLIAKKEQEKLFGYDAISDSNGECHFTVVDSDQQFSLIVLPFTAYWSKLRENVQIENDLVVSLKPVKPNTSNYDWGHEFVGLHNGLTQRGKGIKIGIIDSGINNHPDLLITQRYSFVKSSNENDVTGHGSHIAGIIAGLGKVGIKGYLPEAKIYSYKVLEENGTDDATIVKALEKAIEDNCDIINISLGSLHSNAVMLQQIEKAYEKGIVCIAASGNKGGKVQYPAAYKKVIAVSAIGKAGTYPEDSTHIDTESTPFSSKEPGCFIAKFSSRGKQLNFCAPGVAVISTHLGEGYGVLDGTSMACPHVTGFVGLVLAANRDDILKAPPTKRVELLLEKVHECIHCLGFTNTLQGNGCLKIKEEILNPLPFTNSPKPALDPP